MGPGYSGMVFLSGNGCRTAQIFSAAFKARIHDFLTGLSGSGKSTIARVLMVKFMEMRDRPVTLLDGDIVRKNLSSELTYSESTAT